MKPTSVISIIVAVLLIVAGLITCLVAQNIASSNGEYIFSESRGDDFVNSIDISNDISKIELILSEADINIFGGSEKSYVEFVNFNENYYSLSVSNTILSFDEIPDLMSMLKFWESGFSFKGMRYILGINSKPAADTRKAVNIYIADDHLLKIFDISADKCTVNIKNIVADCDYKITVNEAEINAETVKTGGTFNINSSSKDEPANKVTLNLNYVMIKNLNISAKTLNTDIDLFKLTGNSLIECEDGEISIKFVTDPSLLNLDIRTEASLNVSGAAYMNSFAHFGDTESTYSMKIVGKKANITIDKTSETTAPQSSTN